MGVCAVCLWGVSTVYGLVGTWDLLLLIVGRQERLDSWHTVHGLSGGDGG